VEGGGRGRPRLGRRGGAAPGPRGGRSGGGGGGGGGGLGGAAVWPRQRCHRTGWRAVQETVLQTAAACLMARRAFVIGDEAQGLERGSAADRARKVLCALRLVTAKASTVPLNHWLFGAIRGTGPRWSPHGPPRAGSGTLGTALRPGKKIWRASHCRWGSRKRRHGQRPTKSHARPGRRPTREVWMA